MKRLANITIIVFVVLLAYIFKGFIDAGLFRHITPHSAFSSCKNLVTTISEEQQQNIAPEIWRGCEDAEVDYPSGLVFLSCSDHAGLTFKKQKRWDSGIILYDTQKESIFNLPIEFLSDEARVDFFPHGISLMHHKDEIHLYCTNNGPFDSVYVFRFDAERRTLVQTHRLAHPLMVSLNDIVAVGSGLFYATNDLRFPRHSGMTLPEGLLRLPISFSIECDIYTTECKKVAEGIRVGNGIVYHSQTNRLLIAGTGDQVVHVYHRRPEDDLLEFEFGIPLGSGGDNLVVDPEGVIWIAAHPKVFHFFSAFMSQTDDSADAIAPSKSNATSPSQILTITFAGQPRFNLEGNPTRPGAIVIHADSRYILEEVMLTNGDDISAASTALPLGDGRLLITSVFTPSVAICEARTK